MCQLFLLQVALILREALRKYSVLAVCFLFSVGIGSHITYEYFPRTIEKRVEVEKPIVREIVRVETETQFRYVEKEINLATGQKNTTLEANINHPDVGLRVNRQFKRWDGDVYINQDKDVKGQVTIWFLNAIINQVYRK